MNEEMLRETFTDKRGNEYEMDVFEKERRQMAEPHKEGRGTDAPVKPAKKGFYKHYGCYRNEYWKIPQYMRRDYAYAFADGTYTAVMPGDASPVDGRAVTEEDIAMLHHDRDREVRLNNKERHQESDDFDFLEAMEEEKMKKGKGLPNRYDDMKEQMDKYRLIIGTEAFVDEYGNDCTDHMRAFTGMPSIEAKLGLMEDPLEGAFKRAEARMTENEREVFRLVCRRRLTRVDAAKMLGVSEGTVRYRLDKAVDKVKEDPFIVQCWQRSHERYERNQAWLAQKKKRKKRHESEKRERNKQAKDAK